MCALTDTALDEFRAIIETELFGTFNLLQASVPALKAAGGGAIVLFLTTAVLRTMEYDAPNSVPKAAIAMMLRHVAREAGKDNIRVNGIAPGVIDAGRTDLVPTLPPLVQQVVADCLRSTPLPRLGKPAEVAELAAYLTSDDAGYVNGQIIAVDGGYSV
jgi:NAD(P)-dependent dehydrogenase (short-subunit alcohol dehydrogenase family)